METEGKQTVTEMYISSATRDCLNYLPYFGVIQMYTCPTYLQSLRSLDTWQAKISLWTLWSLQTLSKCKHQDNPYPNVPKFDCVTTVKKGNYALSIIMLKINQQQLF